MAACTFGSALTSSTVFGQQCFGRGQRLVVPLQIEALPTGAEERVEAQIVVLGGGLDVSVVEQAHALIADRLPIVGQAFELGELLDVVKRLRRQPGEHVHQRVVRRQKRGVIGQLACEAMPHSPTEVDEHGGSDERVQREKLGCQHIGDHRGSTAAADGNCLSHAGYFSDCGPGLPSRLPLRHQACLRYYSVDAKRGLSACTPKR